MSWTLCTAQEAIDLAGVGVSSTITADTTAIASYSDMVEGLLCLECYRDWVTDYSGLTTSLKNALRSAAASKAASMMALYDKAGYQGAREQETILDFLDDIYQKALTKLKEFKSNSFGSTS